MSPLLVMAMSWMTSKGVCRVPHQISSYYSRRQFQCQSEDFSRGFFLHSCSVMPSLRKRTGSCFMVPIYMVLIPPQRSRWLSTHLGQEMNLETAGSFSKFLKGIGGLSLGASSNPARARGLPLNMSVLGGVISSSGVENQEFVCQVFGINTNSIRIGVDSCCEWKCFAACCGYFLPFLQWIPLQVLGFEWD